MSNELILCKSIFKLVNKVDGVSILEESDLTRMEKTLLIHCFIREKTAKEIADFSLLKENAVLNDLEVISSKFYKWLQIKGGVEYVIKRANESILYGMIAD